MAGCSIPSDIFVAHKAVSMEDHDAVGRILLMNGRGILEISLSWKVFDLDFFQRRCGKALNSATPIPFPP
jgi:hypothetical protein